MVRLPRRNKYLPLFAAGLCACLTAGVSEPAESQTHIEAIRFWSFGDLTRVVIETRGDYRVHTEQIENPSRLFFDLHGLKPPVAQRKGIHSIQVGDHLVKQIRVAETTPGVTRVVFDLEAPVECTSSQLANPDRLVIEIRAKGWKATDLNVAKSQTGGKRFDNASEEVAGTAADLEPPAMVQATRYTPDLAMLYPPPAVSYPGAMISPTLRAFLYAPMERLRRTPVAPFHGPGTEVASARETSAKTRQLSPEKIAPADGLPTLDAPVVVLRPLAGDLAETPSKVPGVRVTAVSPATASAAAGSASSPAKIDSSGNRSLVRVFGLKLGKVVIDAGHGGHDTGTIGPHGLLEKDLVLDVALRLGQLIQSKMGSQVVYTRSDDTFIALEQRTKIANDEKADLFISIHANSAPIASATGVETYYFNFTTEKASLDLATRENATASSSIHELNDLLQQAVLKAKVEESREFAQKVQLSLYGMSAKMNSSARDRGVRKAPFVVLIGASMPSILAEVGFVSNPHDEPLLKKEEQRQKIAEALYKGIEQYSNTLSHVQMARIKSESE